MIRRAEPETWYRTYGMGMRPARTTWEDFGESLIEPAGSLMHTTFSLAGLRPARARQGPRKAA